MDDRDLLFFDLIWNTVNAYSEDTMTGCQSKLLYPETLKCALKFEFSKATTSYPLLCILYLHSIASIYFQQNILCQHKVSCSVMCVHIYVCAVYLRSRQIQLC